MNYKKIFIFYKKHITHKYKSIVLFTTNQQGTILLPFILILPFFIGLIFLSFEVSHFLQKKAKLSDAIEQATLALTVENDDIPDSQQEKKNRDLVEQYIHAYLPLENFSALEIEINNYCGQLFYRAKTFMSYQPKFITNTSIANKISTINTNDNSRAKKIFTPQDSKLTDIVFVVDYSGSMNYAFDDISNGIKKIDVLRDTFGKLNNTILQEKSIKTIGFIPFSGPVLKIV